MEAQRHYMLVLVPTRGHAPSMPAWRLAAFGLSMLLVAACSSGGGGQLAKDPARTPVAAASCDARTSTPEALGGLTELRGSGSESLFGLVFAPYPVHGTD